MVLFKTCKEVVLSLSSIKHVWTRTNRRASAKFLPVSFISIKQMFGQYPKIKYCLKLGHIGVKLYSEFFLRNNFNRIDVINNSIPSSVISIKFLNETDCEFYIFTRQRYTIMPGCITQNE